MRRRDPDPGIVSGRARPELSPVPRPLREASGEWGCGPGSQKRLSQPLVTGAAPGVLDHKSLADQTVPTSTGWEAGGESEISGRFTFI